jgi:DNA polymerase (family 10)
MNQTGAKIVSIPLIAAKNAALQFCSLISQSCDRIEIAGSIRRKRPYVHDIDIVVIPRFVHMPPKTLFGDPEETSELERRLCELEAQEHIALIRRGERVQQLKLRNLAVPVDLYLASEDSWATLLLIRTGSKEHNIYLCTLAKRLGMQLKADGSGLLQNGQLVVNGSEEAIFKALNLPFVVPEERDGK